MKNTILKVLSVVLILTLALTAVLGLTGCNEEIKENIAKNETGLEEANNAIKTANAAIAKLQADLEKLNGVSATRNDILSDAVTALQENLTANEAALADLNTALQDQATASANALDAKATELQGKIDAAKAALQTQIDEGDAALQAQIDAADAAVEALQTAAEALRNDVDAAATKDALNTAKTALEAADAALQQQITALQEDAENFATQEDLDAAVQAVEAEIQANIDALAELQDAAATKEELQDAIDSVEAEIQANIDALAEAVDTLAELSTALDDAKAELNDSIAAVADAVEALDELYATDEELADEINDLKTGVIKDLQDAIAALDDTYATDAQLTAAIDALREELLAQIEDLTGTVGSVTGDNDFGQKYLAATEILASEYLEDGVTPNPHSYYAFDAAVASIGYASYFESDWVNYVKYCDYLQFRLARAVSEENIIEIFDLLKEYQDNMPTLRQRFDAELAALEEAKITLEDGQLDDLVDLYVNYDVAAIIDASEETRYQNILNARAYLEDAYAKAQADAHDAANEATPIFDVTEEAGVVTSVETVDVYYTADFETTIYDYDGYYTDTVDMYFTAHDDSVYGFEVTDAQIALYGITAEDLTGYPEIKELVARFEQLQDAKDALDAIELTTLPNISACPLWNLLDGIDADIALIEAWAEEGDWGIDIGDDNYELIIDASMITHDYRNSTTMDVLTYEFIQTVAQYAADMTDVYNTFVVNYEKVGDQTGNLAEQVAIEVATGAANVLYTRIDVELAALDNGLNALYDAIEAVDNFDGMIDENYATMIGADDPAVEDEMIAIYARVAYLQGKKVEVDTLYATVHAKVGNVSFSDGTAIKTTWPAELYAIFDYDDLRYIDLEDEEEVNAINYLAMTEDIRADLAALNEEYSGLTAKVQAVYDEVKDIVNSDVNTLGNLQKILWANKKVSALTGVDDPEFPLDDGNGGTVTFTSFRGKLTTKVMQLVALAEAAETEEVEAANGDLTPINTAIAMLGDYDLNKTAEFKNTLATVVEWVEKYLHIDLAEYFEAAIPAPVEPVAYAPEPGPEPADPGDPGPEPLDPGDPGDAPAVVADPGPAPAEVADPGPEPDPILEPAEHAVWETNKADYDQYLLDKADWELAEADYEQYLLDQAAWEAANDAYTDYLAEMMVWTPAHDAYEEYLLEKGVWDANNDDYVAYVEYLAAHNARKAIISNEMDACKALFEDLADVFEATETVDAEDNLNGADGRINGITNFNHPNYGDYQFIEDFEAVLTATDDLIEMYAAAQAAWDELKADIDALPAIDDIRIHDDEIFDAWDAYNAYKDTYYAGTVTNDQFDELATKAVLDAKYTHFCDDIAAAHDLYLEIMALADDLNAIGKPEEFQVDDIIAEVADLRTKIDFYIANYCDEADTDECKFVKDGLDAAVVGYQAQAKALIVKVIKNGDYVDEVEVDGNMYYIGSNPSDRETLKTIFCNMIDGKNTIEFVKADYSQFLSLTLKGGVDPADYPID